MGEKIEKWREREIEIENRKEKREEVQFESLAKSFRVEVLLELSLEGDHFFPFLAWTFLAGFLATFLVAFLAGAFLAAFLATFLGALLAGAFLAAAARARGMIIVLVFVYKSDRIARL